MNQQIQEAQKAAIAVAVKKGDKVYIYFHEKVYSISLVALANIQYSNLDDFKRQGILYIESFSFEEFISTCYVKSSTVLIAFQQSKISFIDVYNLSHLLFQESKICIYTDLEYAMIYQGLKSLETDDRKYCIKYQDSYCIADIGDGIVEILCSKIGLGSSQLNKNEIQYDKEIILTEETYIQFLLFGLSIKWLQLESRLNSILSLNIFYHNIDCIVEQGSSVRNSVRLFSKNETVPYRFKTSLYIDGGKLCLYIHNIHLIIPIEKKLKSLSNQIDVGIDIDPYNEINFTITDLNNGLKTNFNLYELEQDRSITNENYNKSKDPEGEYLEELKACLEEDSEISVKERRLLNRLRDRLGISEERAEELESSLLKPQLTEEEQEYLEEYKA